MMVKFREVVKRKTAINWIAIFNGLFDEAEGCCTYIVSMREDLWRGKWSMFPRVSVQHGHFRTFEL